MSTLVKWLIETSHLAKTGQRIGVGSKSYPDSRKSVRRAQVAKGCTRSYRRWRKCFRICRAYLGNWDAFVAKAVGANPSQGMPLQVGIRVSINIPALCHARPREAS